MVYDYMEFMELYAISDLSAFLLVFSDYSNRVY